MTTTRRTLLYAAPLAAGALLSACTGSPTEPGADTADQGADSGPDEGSDGGADGGSGDGADVDPSGIETLATGLQAPWSIAFHGGTALISERDSARVLELAADGTTREVGVIEDVTPGGEGGLMGLAVHEGHLFTCATTAGGNRIERRELSGEAGALSLGPPQVLLDAIPSASNHNGGRLAIGPDEMLYATTGDAGDPQSAQDLDSLAGKILRIAPDGSVPTDGPFSGSPVVSYGHRNPQGIAWTEDGQLVASEFGQNTWDELNLIDPGADFGWPDIEGIAEQGEQEEQDGQDGPVDPILQWPPADASPSGIAIVGGIAYVACLRGERLRVVPLDAPETQSELLVGEFGRLRDAVVAPDGSLWVLTNTTDGRGDPPPDGDRVLRLEMADG
ncbi:PQQ-dependent sugar dehydrogenase [Brachybacterium sp. AOP43-C2-M15]|uniref:PQQ-dependent sugar dehydrogenase n=1 Tax=Brachybacterium sp. AOP43-C2-M15 TaxID=3457661 RepID=UPI004034A86B